MGKVFQIYGGKNHLSSVNQDSSYSQLSELSIESGARLLEDDSKTLELTSLPRFIRFFRVSHADEIFFEQTIERLSYLTEDPKYVDNGVSFKVLLHELNQCDFMIGCQLTEKEPNAVMSAQVILQILKNIQIFDSNMLDNNEIYRDVNDIDEIIVQDHGYARKFVDEFYNLTRVVRYSDNSQARKRATGR